MIPGRVSIVATLGLLALGAAAAEPALAAPSFAVSKPLSVPRRVRGIAVGDFNNDGVDDVVVASTNRVSIAIVDPETNEFHQAASHKVGRSVRSVAVGDFNQDGKRDILIATATRTQHVVLGGGDGTFGKAIQISKKRPAFAAGVADLDGKNGEDLVFVSPRTDAVRIMLSEGLERFGSDTTYSVGRKPKAVAVADLDGDGGRDDLAVLNFGGRGNDVSILLHGTGVGFRRTANFITGKGSRSISAGDVNGDGVADLIVANQVTKDISVLVNKGGGLLDKPISIPFSCGIDVVGTPPPCVLRDAVAADFDDDGNADLAVAISGINLVAIAGGLGQASFERPFAIPGTGRYTRFVALGKFNGDDKPDLVVAALGDSNLRLLINTSGTIVAATNTPTPPRTGTPGTPTSSAPPGRTPTPTPCTALGCECDPPGREGDSDCADGFCSPEGICCNTPCDGSSERCDLPGFVGTCQPTDLNQGSDCENDAQCLSDFCTDGFCCNERCFESNRRCDKPGEEGVCSVGQRATPTSTVGAPATRTRTRTPAPTATGTQTKNNGASCSGSVECGSGYCADDFCCNDACDGENERCDFPGSEGICVEITPGPTRTPTKTRTPSPTSQPTVIIARGKGGCAVGDAEGSGASMVLLLMFPIWWWLHSRAAVAARVERRRLRRQQRPQRQTPFG